MKARLIAGVLVLAIMGWIAAAMLPVYLGDVEFRKYLDKVAASPDSRHAPPDLIAIQVARQAEAMGIPLKVSDVKVTPAAGGARIELKYVVPVDLILYSVDLHFRDTAGDR